MTRDKHHHSHQLMAYQETTGATAREISLGLAPPTAVGQDTDWDGCRTDLYNPMRGHAGKWESGGAHEGRQIKV